MTDITCARFIVEVLNQLNIKFVFGVPGGAIEPLYNAMAQSQRAGGLRHVGARHETGAAFMAEGYYRETGGMAACCATSGPGATNLLTGVANAYENNVPMLVVTGQPDISLWGKNALQESSCAGLNVMAMFEACTVYNSLVSHPSQLSAKLAQALQLARARSKPVHLSIPVNVQRALIAPPVGAFRVAQPTNGISPAAQTDIKSRMVNARNPLMIIGGGCRGVSDLNERLTQIGCKFVATPDAKGFTVTENNPLFQGIYGFAGHMAATEQVSKADFILALGLDLSEWTTNAWEAELLSSKTIFLNPPQFTASFGFSSAEEIVGDISLFLDAASNSLALVKKNAAQIVESAHIHYPHKSTQDTDQVKPQQLMEYLSNNLPERFCVYADPGNSTVWAIHYLTKRAEVLMRFAPMGWSIGAAVGAKLGNPRGGIVCVTGDGSYLMSGQEITTALQEKLAVVYIVLNDSSLGMVKHGQRLAGAERTSFELPAINYADMAKAMGCHGIVVSTVEDLNKLDFEALNSLKIPTIIDARIDPEEVPPMGLRIKTLNKN